MKEKGFNLSRREFLVRTGVASAAILSVSSLASLITPKIAEAAKDKPKGENINDVLKKFFGDRKIEVSHVKMKAPIIAENGGVVPIGITSDLPMEKGNYVKKMYVFVEKNYRPYTASIELSPANGKATFSLRIKMRKTSNVRAVVETNKGKLYSVTKMVKVTIGGCGG